MAGSTSSAVASSSNPSQAPPPPPPKILLAKPGLVTGGPISGKFGRGGGGDDESSLRSRLPSIGSLNLLSDSLEFHIDRFLPFLTENTDFTVVGIIGPAGVGKSTIMNEIYGFDGSSPGMLSPFAIQSEDTRTMAKHCTLSIEPRVSSERFILLDTQPVFSPSVLADIMRPDGSSTIPIFGESLSAELAHELISVQVDLLKHGIPDPSALTLSHSQSTIIGDYKETKDRTLEAEEFLATPVFVHTKVQNHNCLPYNIKQLRGSLERYFNSTSFMQKWRNCSHGNDPESLKPILFVIPYKNKDDSFKHQYESCASALWKLRDQVLSMKCPSFSRTVSERDWLKNSAKIWELVKNSPVVAEYSRTLQAAGLFRK